MVVDGLGWGMVVHWHGMFSTYHHHRQGHFGTGVVLMDLVRFVWQDRQFSGLTGTGTACAIHLQACPFPTRTSPTILFYPPPTGRGTPPCPLAFGQWEHCCPRSFATIPTTTPCSHPHSACLPTSLPPPPCLCFLWKVCHSLISILILPWGLLTICMQ